MQKIIYSLLFIVIFSISAHAATHSNFIIFGDSLSDSHSMSTNNPGYTIDPRVWGQYMAVNDQSEWFRGDLKTYADSNLDANSDNINYAVGGATAICPAGSSDDNCVGTELNRYFSLIANQGQIEPQTKIIIWIGGNDFLHDVSKAISNPKQLAQNVADTVANDITLIKDKELQSGVMYHIYVVNLPQTGDIPMFNNNPVAKLLANSLSSYYDADLSELPTKLSDGTHQVSLIDMNQLFLAITAAPQQFGFNPADSKGNYATCTSAATSDPKCEGYIFYDNIHPTSAVHAIIAKNIAAAILFPPSEKQTTN